MLVGLVIFSVSSAYLLYYSLQDRCSGPWETQDVKVTVHSPEYLSAGDTDEMRITVVNERSSTATITATLSYTGTSVCLAGDSESNFVTFGTVPPQGLATGRLKVQFPPCFSQLSFQNLPTQQAAFKIWLAVDNQTPQPLDTVSIPIMPVPKSRTLGNLSVTLLTGLVILSGKELWDWIKKAGQPSAEGIKSERRGS